MSDTVKIVRPKITRAANGPRGRVEHDARGNAVWVRTRATDSNELPDTSVLSILEDEPRPGYVRGAAKKVTR
jgi:hypothetical protein